MSASHFRVYALFAALVVIATAAVVAMRPKPLPACCAPHATREALPHEHVHVATTELRARPEHVDYIVAGGGPTPEYNQKSLEDDVTLAAEVFGRERGIVLFGGGLGSNAVQVLSDEEPADDTRATLAAFFDARPGHEAHYELVRVPLHGAATEAAFVTELTQALSDPSDTSPLTLYFAGHGAGGATPSESVMAFWGDGTLDAKRLAQTMEATPRTRPTRLIATSCFSGGLSHFVYDHGQENLGPAAQDRCGFFATTWDEEASGCDPDPDRAAHQGYGVHFLHALRGQSREGQAVPRGDIDIDGDGAISFLEAHAYALLHSGSIDIPTTTSEEFLPHVAAATGEPDAFPMPENDAIIAVLSARLGVAGDEARAKEELATRVQMLEQLRTEESIAADAEDTAYRAAVAQVLNRYPVLDDPWHPDFNDMLLVAEPWLNEFFTASREIAEWTRAQATVESIQERIELLLVDTAPYRRLVRALETRTLAGRLHRVHTVHWQRYERMLACERGIPALPR